MAAQIGALRVTLGADTAQFQAGMTRAQATARRSGQDIQRSMTMAQRTTAMAFGKMAAAAGALSFVALGAAFVRAGKSAIDYAGSLGEASRAIGVTVEQYQILKRAGIENAFSTEQMEGALKKLNTTLGQAKAGVPAAAKAFERLGIDVRKFGSAGEVLPAFMESLSKYRTVAEQSAAATSVGGRAIQTLIPFLVQGADGYNKIASEARRSGLVTAEMSNRADAASDRLAVLADVMKTKLTIAFGENLDTIESLIGGFTRLAEAIISLPGKISRAANQNRINFVEYWDSVLPSWLGGEARANELQTLRRRRDELNPNPVVSGVGDLVGSLFRRPTANTGDTDLDMSPAGRARRTPQRTPQQAYQAFVRELAKEGYPISGLRGQRTRAQQAALYRRLGPGHAAAPGNSAHEFWRGVDLPANADMAKVRAAAARAGVKLDKPLIHGRGGGGLHNHLGFRDAGNDRGDGEEELAKAAEEARELKLAALREQRDHESALARSAYEQLNLNLSMAETNEERQALQTKILDHERDQELAALDWAVELGELSIPRAEELERQILIVDELKRKQQGLQEEVRKREAGYALLDTQAEIEREALEYEADLADTAAKRRDVELRILELAFREERERLNRIIRDSKDADERARASLRLAALDSRQASATQLVANRTRGPMESYMAELQFRIANVKEELEDMQVEAMRGLADETARAAREMLGLDGALGKLAERLISMALDRGIMALLGSIFGPTAMPSFGTVGGVGIPPGFGGGRAMGGPVVAGRSYIVGENGPELIRMGRNGQVIPNRQLGGSNGVTVNVNQSNNFAGGQVTRDDLVRVHQVTVAAAKAAVADGHRRRA